MITILAIRTLYPHWAAKSGTNQYFKHLDGQKFEILDQVVPMGDDLFPLQNRSIKDALKKRIRKNDNHIYDLNDLRAELSVFKKTFSKKIDIIQYNDPEHTLNYLPAWINRSIFFTRKKPTIIGMFHQPKSILKDIISPNIVSCLDHIILMSSEQKEFFINDLTEDKMSVILYGIDTDYFRPDYAKRSKDKFKCITVGHWLRDYDALEMVAESLDDDHFEFHIVSNTSLKKELRNVFFHRNIRDEELLDLYQQAHLLFMPFKDCTANNAIMEGMACGLPVLTTDKIATREYLLNADAFFVKNNDAAAFKHHILHLDEVFRGNMQYGENSRKRSLELSWRNTSKKYASLYLKLAGKQADRISAT